MQRKQNTLLAIDGAVNVVLGILLLLFPAGVAGVLGLPSTNTNFYVSILGAVIFGIGVALFVELYGAPSGIRGLGLAGAIAINLCGGGALALWLLIGRFGIPLRGYVLMGVLAALVLGIGLAELLSGSWRREP
jgi:hypothetical protein